MDRGYRRFLLVRDGFYDDPDAVVRLAHAMAYHEPDDAVGLRTREVYHSRGIRSRLERMLGMRITRWDTDPTDENGVFYMALAGGKKKEVPGVHYDEPETDVTIVVYMTAGLPPHCGTSLWRHRATGLADAPTRADARRLGTTLTKLRDRFERDSLLRRRWIEIDRAGYAYNRCVAYASGQMHSATTHFGTSLRNGRVYQTFRVGVDWRSSRIHA